MMKRGFILFCLCLVLAARAQAGDKPADAAGVKTITDFVASFLGKPALKITPDGNAYHVSVREWGDYTVYTQEDGRWRVEQDQKAFEHFDKCKSLLCNTRIDIANRKAISWLDPHWDWMTEGHGSLDVAQYSVRFVRDLIVIVMKIVKGEVKTTQGAGGLTSLWRETLDDFSVAGEVQGAKFTALTRGMRHDLQLKDFQPQPLLDAWRYSIAVRDDPASENDAKDQSIVAGLFGAFVQLDENVGWDKLDLSWPEGQASLSHAGIELGFHNAGADTGLSTHVYAQDVTLSPGLVPAVYSPFVPKAFDIHAEMVGFDLASALKIRLQPNNAQAVQALIERSVVRIDVAPSHIRTLAWDADVEGHALLKMATRSAAGTVTIKVRNFDKVLAAAQALDAKTARQAVPILTMAKGLAKSEGDALVWVCALGEDGLIKINNLPLGKLPSH